MLLRIVFFVVHAEDDGDVGPLRRRGDDDLLRPRRHVLGGVVAIGEQPGRLEDDVDAEVLPRQLRRIAQRQHLELVAVDRNAVAFGFDARFQVAEHRIVFEQVGERLRARQIVDRDEVDVLVAERRPHDVAPDSTESIDADPDSHRSPPDIFQSRCPRTRNTSSSVRL